MYRKQRGGSSNAKGPGNWIEMGRRIAANCAIHFAALLGVDEDAHSFRILPSIRVRGDTPQLREVMNFGVTLSNPPSEQVLRDAESVIRAWGLRSEVPDTVISRLVSCFNSKFFEFGLWELGKGQMFQSTSLRTYAIPWMCTAGPCA